ncbi:hypothetical protein SAMN05421819_4366 [Bryocella elongata]|uniref:Uncharacterized protein n=1 Tax=Bryocella elongata TaxID=863522 RepID=A0A1H6C9M8_9BACT|nr:hypothetical protein [Bryocella elongata]SEG69618.1 hypothetical protein SAMN05421819_4366 [Bryocella elongata]
MPSAAVIPGPRRMLHVRATWSAREDRMPSVVWLGVLWVGIVAGFGLDFPRYLHEKPAVPMVVHVHAVVFSVWMFLLTAQVLLVVKNRVDMHRKLGWVLVGWVCLMAVLGPWAALASQANAVHTPMYDPQFLAVNIVDIGCFVALFAWGIVLRKNPAAHKRMVMLSMASIADPGFNRLLGYFYPNEPQSVLPWFFYVFYGNVLLVALMAGWDWYKGRLMRQFVVGAALLLGAEFACSAVYFWKPWASVATSWIAAYARHV